MSPHGDDDGAAGDVSEHPVSDGGHPGIDEDELYAVVHDAVEDAILGVVGTLLLLAVGFVLFLSGVGALFDTESTAALGLGLTPALVGLGLFLGTLRNVLSAGEWV